MWDIGSRAEGHACSDASAANRVSCPIDIVSGTHNLQPYGCRYSRARKQSDRLFFALSDPTRRDIVTQTLDRERSVSELGRLYPISLTAVQKHVEVLVVAGLVSKHRSGREQLVRGEVDQLRRAHELLDELETLWRARLERFADVLNETTGKEDE